MCLLPRDDHLNRFMSGTSGVHVMTGVRGSGKTVLMHRLKDRLEEQGIHAVYLDAESLPPDSDLTDLVHERMASPHDAVLIDEVCSISGWKAHVDALHRESVRLYLSSSRAQVPDMEAEHAVTHVLPLSFREFLVTDPVRGDEREEQRFDLYAKQGGMPILDAGDELHRNNVLTEGILDSVLCRDVMQKRMDPSVLQSMMRFLFMSIGTTLSLRRIAQASGVTSGTAGRYLRSLTDSHLLYRADVIDLRTGETSRTKSRFYACDTGIRNAALYHSDDRSPGVPENIVFLELMRRGYRVSSGVYRDHAVDLIAEKDGRRVYVQVMCASSDDPVSRRKERTLGLLDDGEKLILTPDRRLPPENNGIRYRNLIDFLLE